MVTFALPFIGIRFNVSDWREVFYLETCTQPANVILASYLSDSFMSIVSVRIFY